MATRVLNIDNHGVVRQVVEEKTVKAHVPSILKRLGVHSGTQAARTGLVSVDEFAEASW